MISVLLWLPLAAALLACLAGRTAAGWVSSLGALATMGLAIWLVAGFDVGGGLQHTVDESWIPTLGVRYQLGVDGINLFLILLTAVLWFASTAFSVVRGVERPRTYFLMLGLGETAMLGAFLAQDLLLFVIFFDLLLVPFYFLIGGWGKPVATSATARALDRAATLKMVIYTLVGWLLMLVGAAATGILAADGGQLSFSLAELAAHPLSSGSQEWIFWFFAAAFLVKMPGFPLQGWMPDAYRAAPLPVARGVLGRPRQGRRLRVHPHRPAALPRRDVALPGDDPGDRAGLGPLRLDHGLHPENVRLVAGYSSVAQLGFITMGIFSLRPDGADGALLQMVNHGLVVAPIFLIVAVIAERAGTEDMRKLGGIASKAPVLAAMFLIVTLATLAMPARPTSSASSTSSSASSAEDRDRDHRLAGVAMAAYYALRLFQGAMHDRAAGGPESREIGLRDGVVDRRPRRLHRRPRALPAADPEATEHSVSTGRPRSNGRGSHQPMIAETSPPRTSTTPASRRSSR